MKIEFVRNPLYWNDKETVIDKATFLAIQNPSTDVQMLSRRRSGDHNQVCRNNSQN